MRETMPSKVFLEHFMFQKRPEFRAIKGVFIIYLVTRQENTILIYCSIIEEAFTGDYTGMIGTKDKS